MDFKDYYAILGVSPDADQQTIQKRFRELAKKYHPDVNRDNPEAEEKFKEVNEAYQVLQDPERRKRYDEFRAEWELYQRIANMANMAGGSMGGFDWSRWAQGAASEPPPSAHQSSDFQGSSAGGAGTGDPFGDAAWQEWAGGGSRRSQTASDTQSRDSRHGQQSPPPGGASGGDFSEFFDFLFGRAPTITEKVQITLEEAYHGTTRTFSRNNFRHDYTIPPGVETGSTIRVPLDGVNLMVEIEVLPHDLFQRSGDDLTVEFELPLYTALLGGRVPVMTPDGEVQLNIPPRTQNRTRFRLRGKGMPNFQQPSQRGDLYALGHVVLPIEYDEMEQELFEQLRDMWSR
jgi:curved DNA-binding protein